MPHGTITSNIPKDVKKIVVTSKKPDKNEEDNKLVKLPPNPTVKQIKKFIYKNSFDSIDEMVESLSYNELLNHIRQSHPKKTNEEDWPLF